MNSIFKYVHIKVRPIGINNCRPNGLFIFLSQLVSSPERPTHLQRAQLKNGRK